MEGVEGGCVRNVDHDDVGVVEEEGDDENEGRSEGDDVEDGVTVCVAEDEDVDDADAVALSGPPAKRSTSPIVALRPATRKGETDPDGTDAPVGP